MYILLFCLAEGVWGFGGLRSTTVVGKSAFEEVGGEGTGSVGRGAQAEERIGSLRRVDLV